MGELYGLALEAAALQDTLKVNISISLVGWLIWFGTGSIWLATVGMWEIILSVPVAWFINKAIFQINMFPGLNLMTVFIVAAIGKLRSLLYLT